MKRRTIPNENVEISYHMDDEPIVLSKTVLDLLLKQENCRDLISLYIFLYYTAKWQKTNQVKATDHYCMKGLKIGYDKFSEAKKKLQELGLIDVIRHCDSEGRVLGWYIKVYFIWKRSNVSTLIEKPDTGNSPTNIQNSQNTVLDKKPELSKPRTGFQNTNALSDISINALSAINTNNRAHEKNIIPPTLEMVTKYCDQRKNTVNPQKFIDHYIANGWKVGKTKMVDWQASVRTWEKNEVGTQQPKKTSTHDPNKKYKVDAYI